MTAADAPAVSTPPVTGRPSRADLAVMAVGVLGVSTSGPLIAATAAPALAIALWRNALALVVIGPVTLARGLPELRAAPRRAWTCSAVAGAFLALHFAFWVPSLSFTSVASSTALVCMQAVWTAVLARLAGQQVAGRVWLGMGSALVGVLVITGVDLSLSGRALGGDALALAGGVFSAVYVVVGAEGRRYLSTTAYTTVCYAVCAAALLACCLVGGVQLTGFAGGVWVKIVALTVCAQLLGHTVFNSVLRRVSPTVVSLLILLEVPGATIIAAAWLGQVPPLAAVPAIGLILGGIALVTTATPSAATAGPGAD